MRIKHLIPVLALTLAACGGQQKTRLVENFNEGWKFSLEADSTAAAMDFNDESWRSLNLPHDWSIEGEFSDKNPAGAGCAALPGGYGVYRKHFTVEPSAKGKQVFICFDGVYWQSTVYVNGKKVGFRPNGYIGFEYNITDLVNYDADNVVTVTVDNVDMPNSRWYSGSGIYRNVYLKTLNENHIAEEETFVTTPEITEKKATVQMQTMVEGSGEFAVSLIIKNPDGSVAGHATDNITGGKVVNLPAVSVNNPQLWSPETPSIYLAEITILQNGKELDRYSTTFGIRDFSFDAGKGFILNGRQIKINGVCNHHDLGALGTAVNHRAIERQLQILKEMGCNAIRTSHNPPAPELLNLCDSMGFIVMDEAFDMWAKRKSEYDYARYFAEWHERDLTDLIKRDRNHPSVIMWSIGNEILEQWPNMEVDTLDIAQANILFNFMAQNSKAIDGNQMHVSSLLCKKLAEMVKSIDPTRPVTAGNNETEPWNLLFKSGALDIIGFNYHEYNWGEAFKQKFPGMPLIITESTSALQTRGHYIAPADTQYLWPVRWDIAFETEHHKCSAYDNVRTPWGSSHETTLKEYMKYPWCSGIFVWTGFDYLGEPTPYGWPSRSSYFGIIDLAGFPKDSYYLYKSLWTSDDVLHLLPHWNWNAGDTIDVVAYTNLKDVELWVNGKSYGKQNLNDSTLHIMWKVPYEAGEIKAVGINADGDEVSEIIRTAGQADRLLLSADRTQIAGDGYDLSFVTIDITDADGNIVPDACNMIDFEISGPGEIAGLDNGCQVCHESFKGSPHSAFNGKCLCIVRSKKGERGSITLTAKAQGLNDGDIKIEVR